MKDKIRTYFYSHKKGVDLKSLMQELHISGLNLDSFIKDITNMEKDGEIYCVDDGKYIAVDDNFDLINGQIKASNKGNKYLNLGKNRIIMLKNAENLKEGDYVYVKIDNMHSDPSKNVYYADVVRKVVPPSIKKEDAILERFILKREVLSQRLYITYKCHNIYVSNPLHLPLYPGDEVSVLRPSNNKYGLGIVTGLVEEKSPYHVFECKLVDGNLKYVPLNTAPYRVSTIPSEDINVGDKVYAKLERGNKNTLSEIKKLPKKNDYEERVDVSLLEHGFPIAFPLEVEKECEKIFKSKITEKDIAERVDLRDLETFTIDSVSAKDLDDAVSLEKKDNHYILYVSIADVSHYVTPDSATFKEAVKRGTSVYPPGLVNPMLPKVLSDDLCSLNQHEDKLALTCRIELDENGKRLDISFFPSIINSNLRMSYDRVNDVLDRNIVSEEYIPFVKTLKEMQILHLKLRKNRLKHGNIELDCPETEVDISEEGKPIFIEEEKRGTGERLIESFMIEANSAFADYIHWIDEPAVYRDHEAPSMAKINELEIKLREFGSSVKNLKRARDPKIMQSILAGLMENKTPEERKVISSMILLSMSRAYYGEENIGHYGLGLNGYCTFTSPIRRLPDLLNHMFMKEVVVYNMNDKRLEGIKNTLSELCQQSSKRQYESDMVEREITSELVMEYALENAKENAQAKIVMITKKGIYIKTSTNINGFIPCSRNLVTDYKNKTVSLNGQSYKVGDSLNARFIEKDEATGEFIFEPNNVKTLKKLPN